MTNLDILFLKDKAIEDKDDLDSATKDVDEQQQQQQVMKSDHVVVVTSEQDWDRLIHTAGLVLVDADFLAQYLQIFSTTEYFPPRSL